ncbi:MAG: RsbRD N-terminal domain-containing protein [Desulfosudaceae bacterium]
MKLPAGIEKHKKAICKNWTEQVLRTYPAQTAEIFIKEKDRFANPVAGSLSESLEKVMDGLIHNASGQELAAAIDPAIRVRAVQNFSSSEAVRFIFFLKEIIPEVIGSKNLLAEDWTWLDQKVQELALIGFDKYVECREKIFELRAFEVRNRTFRAFERAGLVKDSPHPAPES